MKYSARDPPQARKLAGSRSIDLASRLCLFTTNHNGYNMVAESFGMANDDACHCCHCGSDYESLETLKIRTVWMDYRTRKRLFRKDPLGAKDPEV